MKNLLIIVALNLFIPFSALGTETDWMLKEKESEQDIVGVENELVLSQEDFVEPVFGLDLASVEAEDIDSDKASDKFEPKYKNSGRAFDAKLRLYESGGLKIDLKPSKKPIRVKWTFGGSKK